METVIIREIKSNKQRQFQNVSRLQRDSRSRKAKILTTGIHLVFRGLKFEPAVPPLAGGKSGRFEIGSRVFWGFTKA
jgi:hypothetical protein